MTPQKGQMSSKHNFKQECIPVGCMPSTAVAVTPTPLPCMPPLRCMPPCHTYSPATHAPCHACLPHMSPAMHVPLPCMFPGHAYPVLPHMSSRHTCPFPFCHACPPRHASSTLLTKFLTHACENITFPQLLLRTVKRISKYDSKLHLEPGGPAICRVYILGRWRHNDEVLYGRPCWTGCRRFKQPLVDWQDQVHGRRTSRRLVPSVHEVTFDWEIWPRQVLLKGILRRVGQIPETQVLH